MCFLNLLRTKKHNNLTVNKSNVKQFSANSRGDSYFSLSFVLPEGKKIYD